MHRSHIYTVKKKKKKTPLDSLRKHFIHKKKQLHQILIKKKNDSKYTAYKAQRLCMRINCCPAEEIGNKVTVNKILLQNSVQALSLKKMLEIWDY